MSTVMPGSLKPTVVARFSGSAILGEQGRILFALLESLVAAGYPIQLCDTLRSAEIGKYGAKVFELENIEVIRKVPRETNDKIFLYDEGSWLHRKRSWLKLLRVGFDIFSHHQAATTLRFPYPMHPLQAKRNCVSELGRLRGQPRLVRLFFSGDTSGYTKSHVRFPGRKLSRVETLDAIRGRLGEMVRYVRNEHELEEAFVGPGFSSVVIIDTDSARVSEEVWLDLLGKSMFFLAPPGISMPMCHNIIEAMAVGAIPVTNYPEWFDPALEHLETCIVFDTEARLVQQVNNLLHMDFRDIERLREKVIEYYDRYLAPRAFIKELERRDRRKLDILMVTERYVVKNAKKLGAKSFLLRGWRANPTKRGVAAVSSGEKME